MAPLEPWEKVLVVLENYQDDVHSAASCVFCHGGVQAVDKEAAHEGLIARPSDGEDSVCATCHVHTEMNQTFMTSSLHANLEGYWTVLNARSGSTNGEKNPALEEMFGNHCYSCHTSCGDCHVAQPASVGGGLIEGHAFNKTPSLTRNCTACHGSRVGDEYMGKNEGIIGDVHFRQARMACTDCHTAAEMHGQHTQMVDGQEVAYQPDHRYAGEQDPQCIDCHETVLMDNNVMHRTHGEDFSCQVCHSVAYKSCDGCHVAISEDSGNPFFRTEATYMTFFIGKNTRQDEERPYQYVPVRHVPIAETSFEYYGENLLTTFDALPTWMYSTPHNIQLRTPQTETCDSCHGNAEIFLTVDKIKPEEIKANEDVIIESVPPARFK